MVTMMIVVVTLMMVMMLMVLNMTTTVIIYNNEVKGNDDNNGSDTVDRSYKRKRASTKLTSVQRNDHEDERFQCATARPCNINGRLPTYYIFYFRLAPSSFYVTGDHYDLRGWTWLPCVYSLQGPVAQTRP